MPALDWQGVLAGQPLHWILSGFLTTLWVTLAGIMLASLLALFFMLLRLSGGHIGTLIVSGWVSLFRNTPLLVQLLFWYNLAALFPEVTLPGMGAVSTNTLITPLSAAIIGLSLNEGAFMGEIIRAGLLSVDPNQKETAQAFGMSRLQIMFRILIPQAMTAIIPPTGNQVISMVKATAMVSIIAMDDLLYSVQTIYNVTFQIIPLLIVAVIWYLIITSVLSVIQWMIERHFSKGRSRSTPAAEETLAAEGVSA